MSQEQRSTKGQINIEMDALILTSVHPNYFQYKNLGDILGGMVFLAGKNKKTNEGRKNMKYIKYMIVPLLVLALVLSACGKDEKKEKQKKEDKELKKELVNNEWKDKAHFHDKETETTTAGDMYTFDKDGSYLLGSDGTIDEGTYTVKNKKLKLKSEDYEDRTIKLKKPLKEFKSHDEPGTRVYKKVDE